MPAAVSDDTADAALGNVTGSNAVNVFLGLGLPFFIASAFWEFSDSFSDDVKETWYDKYKHIKELKALCDLDVDANDEAAMKKAYDDCKPLFAVPAGALGTSVTTFCVCALVCFSTLIYRRKTYGYELGGSEKPAKMAAGLEEFVILDVCSGRGTVALVLSLLFPSAEVVGCAGI